jgi:hypothetical protein
MAQIRVIASFVARNGTEEQRRSLLESKLTRTRAEPDANCIELHESNSRERR